VAQTAKSALTKPWWAALGCWAVALLMGCGAVGPPVAPRLGSASRAQDSQPRVVGAYVTFHAPSRTIIIGNGRIRRRIQIGAERRGIATRSLVALPTGVECLDGSQDDFALTVGGRSYTTGSGALRYVRHDTSAVGRGSRQLRIELRPAADEEAEAAFSVAVTYEVPKDLPVIQTWIEVRSLSETPLLVERAATQLATARPATAHMWQRGGRPAKVGLPIDGSPEGGLVWLQSASGQHGPLVVGLASAAPGPLKRIDVRTDGAVSLSTAAAAGGLWVQPGQTVSLPSAYVWVSVGALVPQAAREWTDAVHLARRAIDAASPADVIAAAPDDVGSGVAALAATGALVCVPYAWPTAWDGDDGRAELTQAIRVARDAGGRVGLVAPAAWLPLDSGLLKDPNLALRDASGSLVPASWHGRPGWIAALGSEYGDLALRSLVALIDDLRLDAILLDGPVSARANSGGVATGAWHSPWKTWDGLLRLVNGLKRERPDVHIGVSAATYGQEDGYDITLYPTAFLWRYGRHGEYDGMWRTVQRDPITAGGDSR
jgi:hypothetical protein